MIIRLNKKHILIFLACFLILMPFFMLRSDKTVTVSHIKKQDITLPVIMYHHVTEDTSRSNRYTVTVDELESDILYLADNGYSAVTVQMLLDFTDKGVPLPEKPVMLTFDDGFESFYVLAYPLLKKYNFKAVLSVIGSVTEKYSEINDHNINYSNLTWDEIKNLHSSGLVEIQSHTYDMHYNTKGKRKGLSPMLNEQPRDYEKAITDDLNRMKTLMQEKAGIKATAIAYPYGLYCKDTQKIIKKLGFSASFTCEERINCISSGNPDCLYNLGRFNRESGVSSREFFDSILKY